MRSVLAFGILLGLYSWSYSYKPCLSCDPDSGDACTIGRSLTVISHVDGSRLDYSNCNQMYGRETFLTQPQVIYPSAVAGQTYTLFLVGPDSVSLGPGQYVLLWLQANIPGENFKTGSLEGSDDLAPYMPPLALPTGESERYQFFVFRHLIPNSRVTGDLSRTGVLVRNFFPLQDFLDESSCKGVRLCGPEAGLQFRIGVLPAPLDSLNGVFNVAPL